MERTYTTGAVSGMTNIPIKTIQRYVTDFRDLFSETARQPKKGRRFTNADVKILRIIRRARSENIGDDEIRRMISDPASFPLMQEHNPDEAIELVGNAREMLEQAQATQREFMHEAERLRRMVYGFNERIRQLEQPRRPAPPVFTPEVEEVKQENKKPGFLDRVMKWAGDEEEEEQ